MIKSLSPYYLTFPLLSPATGLVCTSYTLNLYIYDGLKDEQPAEPTYEITKQNASLSEGNEKINIARLVNDFVNFKPNKITPTGLIPANNQAWVRSEIIYNTGSITDEGFPQSIDTQLMLKGYGYGMEVENPQPLANGVLIRNDEFKVSRNTLFSFPILISETVPPARELVITNVENTTVDNYNVFFTINFEYNRVEVQYKQNLVDDWEGFIISTPGQTSPFEVEIPLTPSFYIRIVSYDSITNQYIYSDPYLYSI